MKIIKIGNNFSATVESKTSQAGKEYTSVSICQSSKGKTGEWEKKYLNMFPEDLLKLSAMCLSAYNDYITEETSRVLGTKPAEQPVETQVEDDFINDEIPF